MYLLRSKRKREVLVKSFVYVVLIVTSIIILIPIFWMISTALKGTLRYIFSLLSGYLRILNLATLRGLLHLFPLEDILQILV